MSETNDQVNLSDVIKEQSNTIKTLVGNVQDQQKAEPAKQVQSPIYFTTPQATAKEAPNYMLWIIIALGAYLLFRRR